MAKKMMSFVLAMAVCLSLSTPAMALDEPSVDSTPSVKVVNLSEDITAQELQKIVSSTCAYTMQDDGTIIPIDSVITIEDASLEYCAERTLSAQKAYKVTLSATASNEKIVVDSGSKNTSDIQASATLEMIWIDNFGLNNNIKSVSGSIHVIKGKVSEAVVQWGDGWVAGGYEKRDVTNKTSYLKK